MKKLYIKTYDSDGALIETLFDFQVGTFIKKINGGLGQLVFIMPRKLDTFDSAGDLSLGNKLELWITDEDTGNDARKVYTGQIEQQRPIISGGVENVQILCLGVASRFATDILKTGSQTTLYTIPTDGLTITLGSLAAAEVAEVMEKILAYFQAANTAISVATNNDEGENSIETTENDMQYTFEALTYSEAIKKCVDMAPANWFWYIDENGLFSFKPSSSTADHTFILTKHIKRIEVEKGTDSIKNVALIWDGGSLYSEYKDETSVSLYGRRVQQITDNNIEDQTSMDNVGASVIAENKDPRIRIVMDIIDNNEAEEDKGYDIELIQPGDTCKIVGIDAGSDIFTDNMIIKQVTWADSKATIEVETRKNFDFEAFIVKTQKDLSEQTLLGVPETYS